MLNWKPQQTLILRSHCIPTLLKLASPSPSTHQPPNPPPHFHNPEFFITTLSTSRNISHIKQAHAQLVVIGFLQQQHHLNVANKLLSAYVQRKALRYAHALFNEMGEIKNAVSWSVMLGGFAKSGEFVNVFDTFKELIWCGTTALDNYTLPFTIRACRDLKDVKMGRLVHGIVLKLGLVEDGFVCASLVDMYAKCSAIGYAREVFDDMPRRDVVTWTVMIGGYAEVDAGEALVLADRMIEDGVAPDKVTMVNVVYACAKFGALHKAGVVSEYVFRNGIRLDVVLGTAMIDMYAKCGCVDFARVIFDWMEVKNVRTWRTMISAYGYHGRGKEALEVFEEMSRSGVLPNAVTFISLLYACSHSGLTEEGQRVFSLMWDKGAIQPGVKHYTCMVDLLGRAGKLDEALKLVESMEVEKDEGLWSALLGARRVHGNLDVAEKAARSLLELQPENPGHYILLSNIYARAGRWKEVAKMRNLMTQRRLKKTPGYTWIEIDDRNYQFGVGKATHPQSQNIHAMLKSLSHKLELAGYVPDTKFVLHDVDEEVKVEMLYTHSEKLAIAFGLIATADGTTIRIRKNLRVCGDCHTFTKFVSAVTHREIIVRDAKRFHHVREGTCSCGDYW